MVLNFLKRKVSRKKPGTPKAVHAQKQRLVNELLKTKQNLHTIEAESKKMKKQVDIALQIAKATGMIK